MVKKTAPFFHNCSSTTCVDLKHQVSNDYDKSIHRRPPQPKPKGGVQLTVIEPAQVTMRMAGTYPATYPITEHGMGVETKRCREIRYVDKYGKDQAPTCTERRVYNIPQRTLSCYEKFTELLQALSRGKKGAPPTTTHKILALLGCNKSGLGESTVAEPLSPALISAVTGIEHNAIRKTMENLVKSGKVTSSMPWLDVVNEKQNRLAPKYAKAFDEFVTTEMEDRKWVAFRRIFGERISPEIPSLPEMADKFMYSGELRVRVPKKPLGKKAQERAKREAETWKRRTQIVPPSYGGKPKKARKVRIHRAPKKKLTRVAENF